MRTACKAVVSGRSITSLAPLLTSIASSTTTYLTSKASFGHTMGIPSPKIRTVEVSGMCHTRGVSFGKIIFLKWSSALSSVSTVFLVAENCIETLVPAASSRNRCISKEQKAAQWCTIGHDSSLGSWKRRQCQTCLCPASLWRMRDNRRREKVGVFPHIY